MLNESPQKNINQILLKIKMLYCDNGSRLLGEDLMTAQHLMIKNVNLKLKHKLHYGDNR
jgi:hypothetical protein